MNKFKLAVALIVVLIFGESVGLIFFAWRAQKFSEKLESIKPGYEKVSREGQEVRDKYEALLKENEAIREDRNNLITQAKNMLAEMGRLKQIEETFGNLKVEKELLDKEKGELNNRIASLKGDLEKLQYSHAETLKEKDGIEAEYEKLKEDPAMTSLKKEISILQRQKKDFEATLKQIQKETAQLKKENSELDKDRKGLTARLKELTDRLKRSKEDYAEAVKKNKGLEQEIKDLPGKFSEIARQNKTLIRQTAQMHYNLGVFYTKNKEYNRAIVEFEKVVEITPQDAYAHFNLGYIYAEHMVDRKKAVEHFRNYLSFAKSDDKDIDWAKKYLLTWETFEGKEPMK